jgi:hypothetical protein
MDEYRNFGFIIERVNKAVSNLGKAASFAHLGRAWW